MSFEIEVKEPTEEEKFDRVLNIRGKFPGKIYHPKIDVLVNFSNDAIGRHIENQLGEKTFLLCLYHGCSVNDVPDYTEITNKYKSLYIFNNSLYAGNKFQSNEDVASLVATFLLVNFAGFTLNTNIYFAADIRNVDLDVSIE